MPSGNSGACLLFAQLARLTGKAEWQEAADKQLGFLCGACGAAPAGCAFGYLPMMEAVYGSRELVFALADEKHPDELEAVLGHYAPELTVLKKSPANAALLAELAPFTEGMEPQNGKAAYYICKDGACSLPVTEL